MLRLQLRAKDPELRSHRFLKQITTVSGNLSESGLFTWTLMTNDSTHFAFKVVDECGAYSILNTSVVIKACPCKNGGTCQPDYRDLDGSGNFTCSCQQEYKGTLCEDDVDECLLSPCFNGTCNNTKPGYLCSCYPGYTGRLCDQDINECLSSPCFPGVQCYDMVNGFRCGPCPAGYNGTGETCDRIDGSKYNL